MGTKRMPGLVKQGDIWHINKRVDGVRICKSTGTHELKEAQKYFVRQLETYRQAKIYGVRPQRLFREAATKFLLENQHKRTLRDDACRLKKLDPYIGDLDLDAVHMGTLQRFIDARKEEGVKMRTINHALQLTGHILNLAAKEWMDEHGLTWLHAAPKIKLLPEWDTRPAYPLDWEEQDRLFAELPHHLREMALFAVNTGCRDQEVCQLRWSWQVNVSAPEIGFVFIIPKRYVKNGYLKDADDKLVVLNSVARAVVDRQRGKHPEFVFTYHHKSLSRMRSCGWSNAKEKAGLLGVRVHDLRHTFGRRLRAAGVSLEDREDLLGHKSRRITTHYSRAELMNLWEAANKICDERERPKLVLLKHVPDRTRVKVA